MAQINGSFEDVYKQLPEYCENLKKSNPFATAIVDATPEGRFSRIFISFGASAQGFRFYRPILGLDGTHLKSKYQGILLAATAIDALGCLFPVAHAVVVAEDDENWFCFLQHLRQIIQDNSGQFLQPNILTLLSDRQKGLIDGVDKIFFVKHHGYIWSFLQKNTPDDLPKRQFGTKMATPFIEQRTTEEQSRSKDTSKYIIYWDKDDSRALVGIIDTIKK